MGWNSWDCYGASVTEDEVRGNADYLTANLKRFGWEYVVVDIQWYEPGANSSLYRKYVPLAMDKWSRLIPAENRFPSSGRGRGFRPLAEHVHGLGLKFGIHIMRGIPRQAAHANSPVLGTPAGARRIAHPNSICPWNTDMYGVDPAEPGAQEYYNSLFALYAEWEVDYVKVDDIAASKIYGTHVGELELIRRAIDSCGRPMVLSLSPGPAPVERADDFIRNANLWRVTDDFWDRWELLLDMFDRCEKWYSSCGPGHWPDCDMLPLGHIGIRSVDGGGADRMSRFTRDEQLTLMTLWSIFRSPLMFGGELRDMDEWTYSLLTNREVLAVHADFANCRPVLREGTRIVWTSRGPGDDVAVALFNVGDAPQAISAEWNALGLSGPRLVRNLWTRADEGEADGELRRVLPPHGSTLLRLRKRAGP
ncbi:MAG TPA: glycoside hydrolase family 27 protein [Bacteroidota bacterium]|nr:glycoside hydrolase family 27 protein [Bacteroidota bacterium]